MSNGDHLDVARDDLVQEARQLCPDPLDAVSALFTAGFTILCESIGSRHAVGAMQEIVDSVSGRLAN